MEMTTKWTSFYMGRRPKKFYFEPTGFERIWKEEQNAFLTSPHVPTLAVQSVIRALLRHITITDHNRTQLNREAAEAEIMTFLLQKNKDVHDITALTTLTPRSKAAPSWLTDEVPDWMKKEAPNWLKNILEKSGPNLVNRVLEQACQHARGRMRKESDEVLELLQEAPFHASRSQLLRWIDNNLPTILSLLKSKHKCFTGCPARTAWTSVRSAQMARMDIPPAINNPGAMKNVILAYFHGLQPHTVCHYLEGRKLKPGSPSRKPRQ